MYEVILSRVRHVVKKKANQAELIVSAFTLRKGARERVGHLATGREHMQRDGSKGIVAEG